MMKIVTTSPFYSMLRLRTGIDPKSAAYAQTLAALPPESDEIYIPNNSEHRLAQKYEVITDDDYDLRLLVFSPNVGEGEPQLSFHIYGNGVSVVTVEFDSNPSLSAIELEKACQKITRDAFDCHAPRLKKILEDLRQSMPSGFLEKGTKSINLDHNDICWISRAVILTSEAIKNPAQQKFIREWLENTARSEDADAIISGDIDFSMTWLNYLLVEPDTDEKRTLFSALRIAQFFYASQERLNDNAYHALTSAALEKNVRIVEGRLVNARRDMQMLHILYDTQKGFLNRKKRQLINDLMTVWEFDVLKANGERMVSASDTRITEITNKRSERSSFFTDLILVALALVTVIEVSMYLTEYSREVMSRPALAYQDDTASWILTAIAAIDTDQMLVGGAFVILILVSFYVYWKIKR